MNYALFLKFTKKKKKKWGEEEEEEVGVGVGVGGCGPGATPHIRLFHDTASICQWPCSFVSISSNHPNLTTHLWSSLGFGFIKFNSHHESTNPVTSPINDFSFPTLYYLSFLLPKPK